MDERTEQGSAMGDRGAGGWEHTGGGRVGHGQQRSPEEVVTAVNIVPDVTLLTG